MKLSIIYHSQSGNTKTVANIIAAGTKEIDGIITKCMSIDDIDEQFLNESNSVIFGCPIYLGTISWQMKKWFDTSKKYDLNGKLGACFATENFLGGGADVGELALIGHMLSKGMVVYSSGSANGQPYTHYGVVCIKDGDEFQKDRAKIFGNRIAKKSTQLFI